MGIYDDKDEDFNIEDTEDTAETVEEPLIVTEKKSYCVDCLKKDNCDIIKMINKNHQKAYGKNADDRFYCAAIQVNE